MKGVEKSIPFCIYKGMNKYEFLVQKFNDGELDDFLGPIGGNIQALIALIDKHGYLEDINLVDDMNIDYHNEVYYYISQNYPDMFLRMMDEIFDEISIDENGKVYLTLDNRGDLAELFCDYGRDSLPRDRIETYLEGDWDYGFFDNTTNDIYRDVVEDLNEKNLEFLLIRVLEEVKENGIEIPAQSELLSQIASSQGHEDFVELNESNIESIFGDEDSAMVVLEELEEIKSDLYRVHEQAYESAYQDDLYEDIFNALSEFFIGKGDWVSKPHPSNPDKTIHQYKIEVNDFVGILKNFLNELRNDGHLYSLSNREYFVRIIVQGMEHGIFNCLNVYPPDYADWTKTKEYINEYFPDYF